ncbi:MAG: EamA family transporter [Thermodesulfobacteriota bacterium]
MAYGLCGSLGAVFFVQALEGGPAVLVAPLSELYLVVTVLLAVFFLGESLGPKRLLGLVFMLGGAALLATER